MVDFTSRRRGDDDRGRDRDSGRGSSREERGGRDRDEGRGGRDRGGRDEGRGRDREERGGSRGSGSGKSFQYEERSADSMRERASKGAQDFDRILKDGIKMWKPNDGDNRIRILPPTFKGAKHYGHDIFVHYGVGGDRASYLCRNKMLGEDDPIHEEREIARRDGDEDYAKELEAKRRVLVWLVDRDHPKEGVQAWAMPWTVDRDIIKVCQDKETREVLPIDHPENGYDVEFEKKGTGARTEYLAVQIARRSTPLGDDAWLDYAMDNPLPDQLNFYDYDHIAKAFKGGGAPRDDRSSDRGDDRGGRGRDEGRGGRDEGRGGRDEPKAGDRDGGRRGDDRRPTDEGRSRERGGREERRGSDAGTTWESVHEMTGDELLDLIDQEKIDIDPRESKDDADLADWICDELKLKKAEAGTRRRVVDDGGTEDRLNRLRDRRD